MLKKVFSVNVVVVVFINVNKNIMFIVDILVIGYLDDLKVDELGIWYCMGVKFVYFCVKLMKVRKVIEKK